jgi:hypothetical protein
LDGQAQLQFCFNENGSVELKIELSPLQWTDYWWTEGESILEKAAPLTDHIKHSPPRRPPRQATLVPLPDYCWCSRHRCKKHHAPPGCPKLIDHDGGKRSRCGFFIHEVLSLEYAVDSAGLGTCGNAFIS